MTKSYEEMSIIELAEEMKRLADEIKKEASK
jgi:hypothetical protein